MKHLSSGKKPFIPTKSLFDKDADFTFLNTVEELKEYLLEKADETYKEQFRE